MSRPVVLVVGAGPGISGSVARRFAREGYDAALVGRQQDVLEELADELEGLGAAVGWSVLDITDDDALRAAVQRLGDRTERIDVLHFNPSAYRASDPLTLTPADLADDLALGVGALLTALQAARPYLRRGARVTATGSVAADRPDPAAASLGVQKAGLRNLVHSIDATLRGEGIRAVSVTVRGALSRKGAFTPDKIADAIYAAAQQDESAWRSELAYPG